MRCLTLIVVLTLASISAVANGANSDDAALAVSADRAVAVAAIKRLRASGPAGLEALIAAHQAEIDAHFKLVKSEQRATAEWDQLSTALDAVAAQRDAWASGLYWFTDLHEAMRVAAVEQKPILSLHLLGKLDEERSCANSRFFRTALYPNDEVRRYLASHFVLHWRSVRPVPVITIDFGDGRKIERTVTGNSIHYVLSPKGRVIDALPGLYSPSDFVAMLQTAGAASDMLAATSNNGVRANYLRQYHTHAIRTIEMRWTEDVRRAGLAFSAPPRIPRVMSAPDAKKAAELARSKIKVEGAPVRALTPQAGQITSAESAVWLALAALHLPDVKLDDRNLAMIASKQNLDRVDRVQVNDIAESFRGSIADDTVRNEYMMHRQLHEWLVDSPEMSLAELNELVYTQLFYTPRSDPWLGLAPRDAYAALLDEGLTVSNDTVAAKK